MNILIIIFSIGGFLRYELFGRMNDTLKWKKEALTFRSLKNFEGGTRLNLLLKGFDMTFSYFNIYDRDPDLNKRVTQDSINLWLKYNKISLFGFDFSKTKDVYEIHGEISYARTKDEKGKNSLIKNPYIYGIFGIGRNFLEEKLYFEIQGGFKEILYYQNSADIFEDFMKKISFQTKKIFYYSTFDMQLKIINEKLKFHIPIIYDLTNKDYFSISRISYDFGKGINFASGFLLSGGKGYSPFSEMGKHVGNLFFIEVKYSF
jgi:hypothetical protein